MEQNNSQINSTFQSNELPIKFLQQNPSISNASTFPNVSNTVSSTTETHAVITHTVVQGNTEDNSANISKSGRRKSFNLNSKNQDKVRKIEEPKKAKIIKSRESSANPTPMATKRFEYLNNNQNYLEAVKRISLALKSKLNPERFDKFYHKVSYRALVEKISRGLKEGIKKNKENQKNSLANNALKVEQRRNAVYFKTKKVSNESSDIQREYSNSRIAVNANSSKPQKIVLGTKNKVSDAVNNEEEVTVESYYTGNKENILVSSHKPTKKNEFINQDVIQEESQGSKQLNKSKKNRITNYLNLSETQKIEYNNKAEEAEAKGLNDNIGTGDGEEKEENDLNQDNLKVSEEDSKYKQRRIDEFRSNVPLTYEASKEMKEFTEKLLSLSKNKKSKTHSGKKKMISEFKDGELVYDVTRINPDSDKFSSDFESYLSFYHIIIVNDSPIPKDINNCKELEKFEFWSLYFRYLLIKKRVNFKKSNENHFGVFYYVFKQALRNLKSCDTSVDLLIEYFLYEIIGPNFSFKEVQSFLDCRRYNSIHDLIDEVYYETYKGQKRRQQRLCKNNGNYYICPHDLETKNVKIYELNVLNNNELEGIKNIQEISNNNNDNQETKKEVEVDLFNASFGADNNKENNIGSASEHVDLDEDLPKERKFSKKKEKKSKRKY